MKQSRENEREGESQNQSTQHYQSNTSMVSLEQKLELILQRHQPSPDTPSCQNCSCHDLREIRQQMVADFKEELCLAYDRFVEKLADSHDREDSARLGWVQEMQRVEEAYGAIQDMLDQHKSRMLHSMHVHQQTRNAWAIQEEQILQEAIRQVTQIGQDIDANLKDILNGMDIANLQDILCQYSQQVKEADQVPELQPNDQQLDSLYQQLDGMADSVRVALQQPYYSLA